MIFGSIVINLLFFTTGYCTSTFILSGKKNVRNILFSFPLGLLMFSLFWLLLNTLHSVLTGNESEYFSTSISIVLCVIIVVGTVVNKKSDFKGLKNSAKNLCLLITVMLLTMALHYMKITMIFGDSYNIIAWSSSQTYILSRGFSAFGLPHSNLSAFIYADFYNYSLHPILILNLLSIMFYMILLNNDKTEKIILKSVTISTLLILFMSNNNFIWQSFYINLHVATAVYILMAISIIKDNSESGFTKNIYITLCLVALMLTRMEGVITSFFIIIFYLLNGDFKFDTRRIIFGSFLFFSSVYIAVLGFALVGNRSYSPQRYILFLLLMITTYLVDLIFIRKNKKILRNLSWIIISAAFLTLILLSLSNDELSKSLAIFASNSFNEVYWGLTNHAFVILFAVICYNRIKTRRHNEEHDSHIYLFLFSVLLILILANFHPYRKGWFDSANRMLFHFMPLLVVWIGIEVNKLIFYRKY